MNHAELIARLRKHAKRDGDDWIVFAAEKLCAEAADALEALTATRDDLIRSGLPEQYAPIVMRTVREAIAEARDDALEEAARIADGYRCGGCGMDGKAAAAIRSERRTGGRVD